MNKGNLDSDLSLITDGRRDMTDYVVSIFRFSNERGYFVPKLDINYKEKDTESVWHLTCGGTRSYVVRVGPDLCNDLKDQAADSHFMIKRVTSSLLLAGAGLFQTEAVGRILFQKLEGLVTLSGQLDKPEPFGEDDSEELVARIYDWYKVLCLHHFLRRAADDAHIALTLTHEAMVFIYRGLEWLKEGQKIEWKDIANDLGIAMKDLKEFKQTANSETGVRHATATGHKMRASPMNYATWVCALIDGINAARRRLQPTFTPMSPEEVSDAVQKGVLTNPYP